MSEKEFEFLDWLNILSFIIGVMNYEENLTQSDKQDLMSALDDKAQTLLSDIHKHLSEQDAKIDKILEVLNEKNKAVSRTD